MTLVSALCDDREGLRTFAMRRLANIGPSVIPYVVEMLGTSNEQAQESAAIILARLGADSAPALLEAMKSHPDRRTRWGAAWVLAAVGADARKEILPVTSPASGPEAFEQSPIRSHSEAWSDSWLTKIKQNLALARNLEVLPSI